MAMGEKRTRLLAGDCPAVIGDLRSSHAKQPTLMRSLAAPADARDIASGTHNTRHARLLRSLALLALALVAGCAQVAANAPTSATGVASWYGPGFHGRRTATGERYDQFQLTAAHRTWPLGSHVRVTNLENGRRVIVRINDRGPYVAGRAIDLSLAAARRLGMVGQGTAPVQLDPIRALGEVPLRVAWAVQVGAYRDAERAREARDAISALAPASGPPLRGLQRRPYVTRIDRDGAPLYRVRIGPCPAHDEARQIAGELRDRGLRPLVVEENVAAL